MTTAAAAGVDWTERVISKDAWTHFLWPMVIAGGALRDSWFGKDVKDIDVFIQVYEGQLATYNRPTVYLETEGDRFFSVAPSKLGKWPTIELHKDGNPDYEVHNFLSFTSPEIPGVNFILREGLKKPVHGTPGKMPHDERDEFVKELFEEFPCSISKIAWHPASDTWWFDPEFEESVATKTIYFKGDTPAKYRNKIYPKYIHTFEWHVEYRY